MVPLPLYANDGELTNFFEQISEEESLNDTLVENIKTNTNGNIGNKNEEETENIENLDFKIGLATKETQTREINNTLSKMVGEILGNLTENESEGKETTLLEVHPVAMEIQPLAGGIGPLLNKGTAMEWIWTATAGETKTVSYSANPGELQVNCG